MKILVVNLMQIGDLVLTTPIFRALRQALPNDFIAAAVNKDFAQLLQFNPFINRLFTVDKRSLKSLLSTIHAVRLERFDICLNLNRSERASALAALSYAKRIVGYSKPGFSLLFNEVVPNLKRDIHQVISHFNALDKAGFHLPLAKSDVFIGDTNLNLPCNNIVAFNVGASWQSKRWLPEYFANVADDFINRGFHVAFLGSKADLPIVDDCLSFMKGKPIILTGKLSLLQLAAFFDHCQLLISNDSGPMHIAAARDCKALSIFGSSPTIGFAPWNANHAIIKATVPCHPCYRHICPLNGVDFMRCMKSITPQRVIALANHLINAPHHNGFDCAIFEP